MDSTRRVVVILGAGGTLGTAISRTLAREPKTDLVLSDLSEQALRETVAALPAGSRRPRSSPRRPMSATSRRSRPSSSGRWIASAGSTC